MCTQETRFLLVYLSKVESENEMRKSRFFHVLAIISRIFNPDL